MNNVFVKSYKDIPVNRKEVFRYMHCSKPSEETERLLEKCIDETKNLLSYKVCYSVFDIDFDGDMIDLGFSKVASKSLAINLKNCEKIVLFAATVGHSFDLYIKKEALFSQSEAVCLQALGSERVESLCDLFNSQIKAEFEEKGYFSKPRFSPGYGDLSLELQKVIIPTLECTKILGISLSENLMMSPSKSVTAIIGFYKN